MDDTPAKTEAAPASDAADLRAIVVAQGLRLADLEAKHAEFLEETHVWRAETSARLRRGEEQFAELASGQDRLVAGQGRLDAGFHRLREDVTQYARRDAPAAMLEAFRPIMNELDRKVSEVLKRSAAGQVSETVTVVIEPTTAGGNGDRNA
jgi:hypothetical protein